MGCHFYCKSVKSGETVVCHTCRLHGPLLSLQLMGEKGLIASVSVFYLGVQNIKHLCLKCRVYYGAKQVEPQLVLK